MNFKHLHIMLPTRTYFSLAQKRVQFQYHPVPVPVQFFCTSKTQYALRNLCSFSPSELAELGRARPSQAESDQAWPSQAEPGPVRPSQADAAVDGWASRLLQSADSGSLCICGSDTDTSYRAAVGAASSLKPADAARSIVVAIWWRRPIRLPAGSAGRHLTARAAPFPCPDRAVPVSGSCRDRV